MKSSTNLVGKWYSHKGVPRRLIYVYNVRKGPNEILFADSVGFIEEQGRWFSDMEEITIIEQERLSHYLGTEENDLESKVT